MDEAERTLLEVREALLDHLSAVERALSSVRTKKPWEPEMAKYIREAGEFHQKELEVLSTFSRRSIPREITQQDAAAAQAELNAPSTSQPSDPFRSPLPRGAASPLTGPMGSPSPGLDPLKRLAGIMAANPSQGVPLRRPGPSRREVEEKASEELAVVLRRRLEGNGSKKAMQGQGQPVGASGGAEGKGPNP